MQRIIVQVNKLKNNIQAELDRFLEQLQGELGQFIGFPVATDIDYSRLAPFFNVFMNNIGDPYDTAGLFRAHCKDKEQEVIGFYADLLDAPRGGCWGYVTSGSTEGNLYGLYVARERYPDGIVFYSEGAHYSIAKNCHLLGLTGVAVPTQENGEIDYLMLMAKLAEHRDRPAIVVATVGTTMTEARDDPGLIRIVLAGAGIAQYHIHCDAALAGNYACFIDSTERYDFGAGADTMAVSGYKFLGTPMPCGVVLCRAELARPIADRVAYIANPDSTISGSRSGHAPLAMWYAITALRQEGFQRRYEASLGLADYALRQLQALGWKAWRNPGALTVMLAAPPPALRYKWQLATADGWSHVICLPGVTKQRVDAFVSDLRAV